MATSDADQYTTLAEDYHWLLSEEPEAVSLLARHADRLAPFGAGASILDCACGVGADAVALARRGFRVSASDGSEAMVAEASRFVAEAGVAVPVQVCRWERLAGCFQQPFDVVLCLGNSISHLPGDAMVRSLQGMGGALGKGGLLIINARNWEKLREERPRLTVRDRVVARDGHRCVPLYIWSYGSDWGTAHHAEIVFLVEASGRVTARRHELEFWPFRATDLHDRLRRAGFRVVATSYTREGDWYEVAAEKMGAVGQ